MDMHAKAASYSFPVAMIDDKLAKMSTSSDTPAPTAPQVYGPVMSGLPSADTRDTDIMNYCTSRA